MRVPELVPRNRTVCLEVTALWMAVRETSGKTRAALEWIGDVPEIFNPTSQKSYMLPVVWKIKKQILEKFYTRN